MLFSSSASVITSLIRGFDFSIFYLFADYFISIVDDAD